MIRKIPLHAKVMCTDGLAGESISVVINPATKNITHLVVQDITFPKIIEWLVPFERVIDSASQVIHLNCTQNELGKMQPFEREHYLEQECEEYGYAYSLPHMLAPENLQALVVEEPIFPQESMPLNRGTDVMATDGRVGQIEALMLDARSGQITHLVLMRGHIFEDKEVVLPVALIERAELDAVFLQVDRKFINDLPSSPVNRPWKEVNAADLELMAWNFNALSQADEARKLLMDLEKSRQMEFLNLAIITKTIDGKVTVREVKEIRTRRGAFDGAIAGGLIGLLIGPGGAAAGTDQGAAAGKITAMQAEVGASQDKLQAFQEAMAPGTSAIVILVEHRWYETARQSLASYTHKFFHQRLSATEKDQLLDKSQANRLD